METQVIRKTVAGGLIGALVTNPRLTLGLWTFGAGYLLAFERD